jgi:hypothetical protein
MARFLLPRLFRRLKAVSTSRFPARIHPALGKSPAAREITGFLLLTASDSTDSRSAPQPQESHRSMRAPGPSFDVVKAGLHALAAQLIVGTGDFPMVW